MGDEGQQVGNGRWASKHLEYQTYEPYQVAACWFYILGNALEQNLCLIFPADVQR